MWHIHWCRCLISPCALTSFVCAVHLRLRRYGLTGNVFGPASAYTSLALFNLLRMPLAFLPIMITSVINALVALTRIGDFLQKPESGLEALHKAAEATPTGHVKVGTHLLWWCLVASYCAQCCSPLRHRQEIGLGWAAHSVKA
jgi:hypothetical protein